jgi:hypothetical protein
MILHPAILALLMGSLLTSVILVYAGWYGAQILLRWDIDSGSELQLALERRTYLISTILAYALTFETLSLFLFLFTADHLHGLFTGAMCAAGTLNVSSYGYPVLILKIVNVLLAGVWLVLNHADTRAYDYPLVRAKYGALLFLLPAMLIEASLQYVYFAGLRADVITSCCGSLFSRSRGNIAADVAALPIRLMTLAFYGALGLALLSGVYFYLKAKGGYLFSLLTFVFFCVAVASLISFICLYFYELPTHHCPFCILQREYGYVGYVLYAALLGGGIAGLGVGALMPFRERGSLARIIPPLQRRLAAATLALYLAFTSIVSWRMLTSALRLGG